MGRRAESCIFVPTHGDVLNDGRNLKKCHGFWVDAYAGFQYDNGENGINPNEPMTLETVDRFAREIGFKGRYQLNLPKGETGVWTLSQDLNELRYD